MAHRDVASARTPPKGPRINRLALKAYGALAATALSITLSGGALAEPERKDAVAARAPMIIIEQGSFAAGGKVIGDATSSLHCAHGFVEFQIPQNARKTNLLMWHSSSTAVWQNRWDGGEGFQSIFLRKGYPVYLWDGPAVGRAGWGCEDYTYTPAVGRDQANFVGSWRFGPSYLKYYPGIQFPKNDPDAWNQATRARYVEFDTTANAKLQASAAAEAVDRIGPTVAITNSAGGFRAMLTRLKSDNLLGIYAYETPGFVFPEGQLPSGVTPNGPFGPAVVPLTEFKRLTEIPIVIAFGDNVSKVPTWQNALQLAEKFVQVVNNNGGNAQVIRLTRVGLRGNTHIPMADMNNTEVADLLANWLHEHGFDLR